MGTHRVFFHSSKGLQRRDPLSLYLFIMVEALSHILDKAKEGGFLGGFSIGKRGKNVEVSHLLFTQDKLISVMPQRRS